MFVAADFRWDKMRCGVEDLTGLRVLDEVGSAVIMNGAFDC